MVGGRPFAFPQSTPLKGGNLSPFGDNRLLTSYEDMVYSVAMATKNPCGKTRPVTRPYEIWEGNGFTYKVLKKYKNPESEAKDPYARWFLATSSPFTFGSEELGDGYARDVRANAVLTHTDYDE